MNYHLQQLSKYLVILVLAAAAMVVSSCSAGKYAAPTTATATSGPVIATDPTLENALAMIVDGRYAEASKVLEPLAQGYERLNEPKHSSQSLFWLGYCKEKTGNSTEAAKYYRRVMSRYPQAEAAHLAQDRLDALPAQ